jgi:N-acetylglucosamine malate deacetylase 1
MNSILVIAAHPDDEVLGCGGTIAKYSEKGHKIHIAFLSDGVFSRSGKNKVKNEELARRKKAARKACKILGANSLSFENFPDNSMDTVPLLNITKKIEMLINKHKPSMIFTHHSGDINIDHKIIHQAVITACRPQKGHTVKTLLFFEVPSSTEWQISGSGTIFSPNWFEDISETYNKKILALEAYEEEMREWPHPRSIKGVSYLNKWRGGIVGVNAAEAFMLGRKII